jgi:hypothetical protein
LDEGHTIGGGALVLDSAWRQHHSQGDWAWHSFLSEGVEATLGVQGCIVCPWDEEEYDSISSIQDRGFEVSFRGTKVLIHHKQSSVISGKVIGTREGNLYILLFQPLHALASSNSNNQLCELWHQRMAHLHDGDLRVPREIVKGLPQFDIEHQEVCKGSTLGKYTKTVFPNSDNRLAGVLDLIHNDVCGPMSSVCKFSDPTQFQVSVRQLIVKCPKPSFMTTINYLAYKQILELKHEDSKQHLI